jgi:hypothetical protein
VTPEERDELRRRGAEYAERKCAEQGIPLHVEDPGVVDQLRRIFTKHEDRRSA